MTPAETEAENLIIDFGFTLPIIPEEVCNAISTGNSEINYREETFTTPSICGVSLSQGKNIEIVVNSEITNLGRKHFTGAHEIGHVLLHIQKGKQSEFTCTSKELSSYGDNQSFEKEANEFASSLLLPKHLIGQTLIRNDLSWALIEQMRKDSGASLEATARRIVKLSQERCALLIHKDGKMWVPIRSSSFDTFIDSSPFPSHLSTSPDKLGGKYPEVLEECDTTDFISNPRNLPDSLYFSSIRNKEYDRVMTLIVAEETEPEDDEDEWEPPHF